MPSNRAEPPSSELPSVYTPRRCCYFLFGLLLAPLAFRFSIYGHTDTAPLPPPPLPRQIKPNPFYRAFVATSTPSSSQPPLFHSSSFLQRLCAFLHIHGASLLFHRVSPDPSYVSDHFGGNPFNDPQKRRSYRA